jgi:hypothetical protein
MQKIVLTFLFWLSGVLAAGAQSSPNFYQGFVPTPGQWKSYFAGKQDVLNYTPVNKAGDTMLGKLNFSGAAPAISSGGGTAPSVAGNDMVGEITMGTGSPTTVVLTFGTWVAKPKCVVSWQINLASMQYAIGGSGPYTLTITQTATSSNKINFNCAATP